MALKFIKDLLGKWYSFRVLVMKTHLEMELQLHSFWTSSLEGSE